jgi:hypothetical protein
VSQSSLHEIEAGTLFKYLGTSDNPAFRLKAGDTVSFLYQAEEDVSQTILKGYVCLQPHDGGWEVWGSEDNFRKNFTFA